MSPDVPDEQARRRESWGFEVCCEDAFEAVRSAWNAYEPRTAPGPDGLLPMAQAMSHGLVAPAFAEDVLGEGHGNERLAAFAAELAGVAGPAAASGLYLTSAESEHSGRTADAESVLHAATLADPTYRPALADLSWYEADRGDADSAVRLLRRAGVPNEDPKLGYLLARLALRNARAGRNDLCPCGSGRKHKACCLDSPLTSLESRAGWLCQKIVTFTLRPPRRARVEGLFDIVGQGAGPAMAAELIPVLIDVAAFEGGGLEEFIVARGDLIPPDELTLARSWHGSRLALREVVATEPGSTVTFRDTRTDEIVVVTEHSASHTLRSGVHLLGRVVAAGTQHQIVGLPLTIMPEQRESVIELLAGEPTGEEIAQWLGAAMAPTPGDV